MPCFFLIIENPLWGLEWFGSTSSGCQWGFSRSFHISSTKIFSFITIPPQLSSIFPGVLNYCFGLCTIFCWREKFFFSLLLCFLETKENFLVNFLWKLVSFFAAIFLFLKCSTFRNKVIDDQTLAKFPVFAQSTKSK